MDSILNMEQEKITIVSKKDLDISYFIGPGAGGQNKQKNATGVQIIHRESGAIGQASDTRSQDKNKRLAFQRLNESVKFKVWLNKKLYEIRNGERLEDKINRQVDRMMEDVVVEIKDENGNWVREN